MQIALLLGCFCSVAVATIGYVAAMLLVKIEEEEVSGRVKFQGHLQVCIRLADFIFSAIVWRKMTSRHGIVSRRVLLSGSSLLVRGGAEADRIGPISTGKRKVWFRVGIGKERNRLLWARIGAITENKNWIASASRRTCKEQGKCPLIY